MPTPFGINPAPFEKAINQLMTATADIRRKSQVADTTGGFTDTYTVAFTTKCYFYRADILPLERENTFSVQTLVLWNFLFPARTNILPTDKIVVDGRTFEVITGASSSFDLAARVMCREIV